MKVLHVVPSYYPAHVYGGPIESLRLLCRCLVDSGCEVRVLTTNANGLHSVLDVETSREVEIDERLRIRYCPRLIRHSVSWRFLTLLPSYVRWADIVHLTAVYSFPTIPTLLTAKLFNKPLVWSPRGALQRWQGSKRVLQKRAWNLICRLVTPQKVVLHTTSQEEAKESLEWFPSLGTAIIPNGVEIPADITQSRKNGLLKVLYLGRLDPKKGIDNLLDACVVMTRKQKTMYSLKIVGGGDPAYAEALRAKIATLSLSNNVEMLGEVFGTEKRIPFQNADVVIVPSHTENFGMVVAEALAHGVPVIASKGTPWRRLEELGCGQWVDNDPSSLANAMERMSEMPLCEMGQRGRQWMQREFSWSERARKMLATYGDLAGAS